MAASLRLALAREAPMHKLAVLSALSTLVLSTFFVIACDDAKNNVAAPTTFHTSGASAVATDVSANVTAGVPVIAPNADPLCGAFTIPLSLTVTAGTSSVAITSISAQFTDTRGIPMPQVTLPAPVPTVQFGSELMAAKSIRTIPLFLPIGCVVSPAGHVVVFVSTNDGHGHSNTTSVSTPVGPPGTGDSGNGPGNAPPNVPR